ncbi:MAG: bifunctional phosphoribosylaminoimidazolecarboxamide formyltransferase/IMP cyclohydrolase PurH, partial [Acidimicrobiaceae bacterium]|nr:bifunctional phosphoribosylaminoimidazolecarboxamide formyltransferase/IMP cyclohydrolase PurH [Acidimicrobiaceae bacterium]
MDAPRALIAVFDKTGVVELAAGLVEMGWELIASAGTAGAIAAAGLPVVDVADHTGSPTMLGHRVVTLHPRIHGGILADRDDPAHRADLEANGIEPIDLVVSNLYPFEASPGIETIDIGGPTMVRAAAKNHAHVGVVVDPVDYPAVLDELRGSGRLSEATRRNLARRAFAHTAAYEAAISGWFDVEGGPDEPGLPAMIRLGLERADTLRYGENPHQQGARYRSRGTLGFFDGVVQHGGQTLSYLNLMDAAAAWRLAHDLG